MRYRKLTPNGDYSMGHGAADWLVNTPQTVAQAAQTRLGLYSGEWFLDSTEGTPWRTQVLGRVQQSAADLALQARVLGTQGLTGINAWTSVDTQDRHYSVTAQVSTIYDAGASSAVVVATVATAPVITAPRGISAFEIGVSGI